LREPIGQYQNTRIVSNLGIIQTDNRLRHMHAGRLLAKETAQTTLATFLTKITVAADDNAHSSRLLPCEPRQKPGSGASGAPVIDSDIIVLAFGGQIRDRSYRSYTPSSYLLNRLRDMRMMNRSIDSRADLYALG
jgi:hypothetical protein